MPRRVVDLVFIGGLPVVHRVLLCGRWFLHAFYDVYERKEIT
jgi:hypothetical protein